MEEEIYASILGLLKAKAKTVIVSVILLQNWITLHSLFLSECSGYWEEETQNGIDLHKSTFLFTFLLWLTQFPFMVWDTFPKLKPLRYLPSNFSQMDIHSAKPTCHPKETSFWFDWEKFEFHALFIKAVVRETLWMPYISPTHHFFRCYLTNIPKTFLFPKSALF